jgi:hypothetical protein
MRPIVPSLFTAGNERRGTADSGNFLNDDARGDRVGALAPVLLGNVDGVEAGGVESVERFLREALLLVDVRGMRRDFLLRQAADAVTELAVLVRQLEEVKIRVESHERSVSWGKSLEVLAPDDTRRRCACTGLRRTR